MADPDLQLHAIVKNLDSRDLPLHTIYKLSSGDVTATYPTHGSYWHDIVPDTQSTDGVYIHGNWVPYGSYRKMITLPASGAQAHVSYVYSNAIPEYPGRVAYWLIIDDM